ncbi:hypothetical protein TSUD_224850 [Trifolium subterraneum]|uniref:Remorin C-terminal domain-containing protein n=1 Tax=Trifolium subterraneum TaxID=3900 RepID=A0A2Z6M0Q9_TRISU|nr:hypothetical protein TSUD_224850 [Trifolium subterraneum]
MKKNSGTSQKLGSFLSPKEPNYSEKNNENQKGWNSERVLLQPTTSNMKRQACVAGFSPFNSGRTIPSKWDDAERWICSPVSASGYVQQHQRKVKSKSGPIMPQGTTYYSDFSPTIPLRNSLVVKNLMMSSPFTTGVLAPDVSLQHYYAHDNSYGPRYDDDDDDNSSVVNENGVGVPLVSKAPSWSELLSEPSSPNSRDEKCEGTKNEDTVMSPFSKIDRGTQMSSSETENEDNSSPESSSPIFAMDQKSWHSEKLEIRDVQVDCQAKSYASKLSSLHGKELKESGTETQASGLDIAESTLDTSSSKFERDEAKISAWESLQKAKAEAAIKKLEMKLEKKKSSSMDKILNKLRRAQMKAEKMRNSTVVRQEQHVSKTWKVFSLAKYGKIWSSSSCFASQAL